MHSRIKCLVNIVGVQEVSISLTLKTMGRFTELHLDCQNRWIMLFMLNKRKQRKSNIQLIENSTISSHSLWLSWTIAQAPRHVSGAWRAEACWPSHLHLNYSRLRTFVNFWPIVTSCRLSQQSFSFHIGRTRLLASNFIHKMFDF